MVVGWSNCQFMGKMWALLWWRKGMLGRISIAAIQARMRPWSNKPPASAWVCFRSPRRCDRVSFAIATGLATELQALVSVRVCATHGAIGLALQSQLAPCHVLAVEHLQAAHE